MTHNDKNPSSGYEVNGVNLGSWVATRRLDCKKGKLSVEQIAQLEAAGIIWDPLREEFERNCQLLKEYTMTQK